MSNRAPPSNLQVRRLGASDLELARRLFTLMAHVFEEDQDPLSDAYVQGLLAQSSFWAIAALAGEDVVGGLTAHTLPMTRTETPEVFIYDIAVRTDLQRRGVGRRLLSHLRDEASLQGIRDIFVPADIEDIHALEFYRATGAVESPVAFFTFSGPQPS
jgi:aminoglycoside 3-N-acetyltransferase I